MIVYHHNDMDGKGAAFCVHRFKPKTILDSPSSYVMMGYEDEFNKHTPKDDVIIVDLSISENTYHKLLDICKTARTVTWIDHHESSVSVIAKHKEELQSIKNLTYFISKSACGAALTYTYFNIPYNELLDIRKTEEDEEYSIDAQYNNGSISVTLIKKNKKNPTDYTVYNHVVKLPLWLFHIDDYDCWKKIDENTEYFILGAETENSSFTRYSHKYGKVMFTNYWAELASTHSNTVNMYIAIGKNINKYIHSRYTKELRFTFEYEYEGTKFICKNDSCPNSYCFEGLIEKYPAAIKFNYNGKIGKWMYSVYSSNDSDFNCKEFCEKFGGGGHIHAAGFSSEKLLFTMHKEDKCKPVIFLGGTCNNDDWRTEFIQYWKKNSELNSNSERVELFNPVVENWTKQDQIREEETKKSAFINLFVITPNMKGTFSIAEAVECANNFSGKTVLAICNKYNDPAFDESIMKSFDAVGEIIEKHNGLYLNYSGEDAIKNIVTDVMRLV